MSIMIAFAMGLLGGGGAVAVTALRFFRPRQVDYKERWLQAVRLLGQEGRVTDEQLASLKGPVPARPRAPFPSQGNAQRELNTMHSSDRRTLEIERARNGLPPLDNLNGMHSSDKRQVLAARTRYGQTG